MPGGCVWDVPKRCMQDAGHWGGPSGPPSPYLGREQRQRSSLASSAAEHHAAPQALLLVVTCRRALPSLSVPPAELKQDSDPSHPARPWGLCTAHAGIAQQGVRHESCLNPAVPDPPKGAARAVPAPGGPHMITSPGNTMVQMLGTVSPQKTRMFLPQFFSSWEKGRTQTFAIWQLKLKSFICEEWCGRAACSWEPCQPLREHCLTFFFAQLKGDF